MKETIAGAVSILAFAGSMIGIFAPSGEAAMTRETSRDLALLQVCITMLNENTRLPLEGELVVKKRLSDHYDLTLGQVDGLLGRNMLYGDLAAVLEFAKKMPGGVKDENIKKVVNLRQNGTGWDQIAENLHIDLSDSARSVSRFEEKTHSRIKKALVESGWEGEAAGGTDGSDR